MPKVFDTSIVETSTTTGTGTYTLNGPRTGYRSFDEGFNSTDTPFYVVRNAADDKYEINRGGVFTSGTNTLTRGVYLSSNGNAPVSWAAPDHPLLVYIPDAVEIMDLIIRGFRGTSRSVWLQTGALWTRSDFPTSGKDTLMFYDGSVDVILAEEEGGTAFFHNKPPGEYVDLAYNVTAGSEPRGLLICDGTAVSRTTYSKLFSKLSTTHGAGNGTTTFNKPDTRGRNRLTRDNQGGVAAGVNNTGYFGADKDTQGAKGGYIGHTGGVGVSVSVSVAGSISGSTWGQQSVNYTSSTGTAAGGGFLGTVGGGTATPDHTHGFTVSVLTGGEALGVTGGFSGSGSGSGATSAFTIMQPGIVCDTLITTGGQ